MHETLSTFRSFNDRALAEALAAQLHEAGIPVRVRDESSPIDPLLSGNYYDEAILVQLAPADFPRAQAFLEDLCRQQLDSLPPDYYLYEFSDAELRDILEKPDEWNPLDYVLAQQLLAGRGHTVTTESLQQQKTQRLKTLSQQEPLGQGWHVGGWILTIFYSLIGLFFGLALLGARKTLPDGSRTFLYAEKDRNFGRSIAWVSGTLFGLQAISIFLGMELPYLAPWPLYLIGLLQGPF